MKHLIIFLIVLAFLVACSPTTQSTPTAQTTFEAKSTEAAQQTLERFFTILSNGQYSEASYYYGSTYDTLIDMNPDIDQNDKTTLWKAGCEFNGFQCKLSLRSAVVKEQSGDTIRFTVEFSNPDGSLFVLGPCCGTDATDMPPVTQFEFLLSWIDEGGGRFVVMTMPVYVP